MSEVFLKIVNMSISASWLALAVLLLRLVLKKAPKWVFVLLWGFVAVRLICPFSIESALSLIPSKETVSPDIMLDWTPEINAGVPVINSALNPVITQVFAPNPVASANPLQIVIPFLAAIWLIGVAVMLIYAVVSYWLLHRKVAAAILWRGNVFQSERVNAPFVLGIVKPRIYLPFHVDADALPHVIAHEQAHIRRKDHWWKPLGFLLLTIYWFNPFLWVAYILLCRDIELACDESVIGEMNSGEKAAYTQALVNCSVKRRMIHACPLAFGEVGVKERVKSVMNYKKPAFWIVVLSIVVCGAVAVCFLTDPKRKNPDTLPKLYSHSFAVAEVTYETPVISYTMTAGKNTPAYAITEDMQFLSKEVQENARWVVHGMLTETELTKENFDDLFFHDMGWASGNSSAIRRNNAKAYQLVYDESILIYVLQQNNGDVYLARGYYDALEKDDPGSHDSSILWLFKLTRAVSEDTGIIAMSGGNTVPGVVFLVGTSIQDVKPCLYWLDIVEDGDKMVPFEIFCDGKEMYGWYSVYDAETMEALDFIMPSGLAPQTYLFQNAEYGRDYIVTLQINEADMVCFGARLREATEQKYYLTIGAEGVAEIGITTPDSSDGCVNADASLFQKGDKVWLSSLDGLKDLRGVVITAEDKNGKTVWALSIPEGEDTAFTVEQDGDLFSADGWIIHKERLR